MALVRTLSQYWLRIQSSLFPWLEEELGGLTEKEQKLVATLDLVRVERFTAVCRSLRGRPPKERAAVARAFVAKAVYNMTTTRALLDRLGSDQKLRRICGWEQKGEVPSESTFSRAFAESSESQLPAVVHEAMIKESLSEEIINHISRDATEIEAREKPARETKAEAECAGKKPSRKPGQPLPFDQGSLLEQAQWHGLQVDHGPFLHLARGRQLPHPGHQPVIVSVTHAKRTNDPILGYQMHDIHRIGPCETARSTTCVFNVKEQ